MGTLEKVAMLHIRTFLADGLVIFLIVPKLAIYLIIFIKLRIMKIFFIIHIYKHQIVIDNICMLIYMVVGSIGYNQKMKFFINKKR